MEKGAQPAERPFAVASAFQRRGPHRFALELTEDWYQGRAIYGGLSAAIMARVMGAEAGEDKLLRTLHTTFCAPGTAGEVEVHTEVVRSGRSVAFIRARMEQAGQPIAIATATFARQRRSSTQGYAPPSLQLPPVEEVPSGPEALYIPAFSRYFEFRQALGHSAFSGAEQAHVGGWCRLKEGPVPGQAALAPLFLDSWAPAALSRSPHWAPCASIDIFVQIHTVLGRDTAIDWLGYEARSEHLDSGYADEQATLFFPDGRPIASSRQLIAIFE